MTAPERPRRPQGSPEASETAFRSLLRRLSRGGSGASKQPPRALRRRRESLQLLSCTFKPQALPVALAGCAKRDQFTKDCSGHLQERNKCIPSLQIMLRIMLLNVSSHENIILNVIVFFFPENIFSVCFYQKSKKQNPQGGSGQLPGKIRSGPANLYYIGNFRHRTKKTLNYEESAANLVLCLYSFAPVRRIGSWRGPMPPILRTCVSDWLLVPRLRISGQKPYLLESLPQ